MIRLFFLVLVISIFQPLYSQSNDIKEIERLLDEIAQTRKGINDKVRIDISGLTLYDFIIFIADEHRINVSVDRELNQMVSNNFYDVEVKDVFLFLIQKYDIEVSFLNNIISFSKKKPIVIKDPPKIEKPVDISYNPQNDFLSVKLTGDSLPNVAQRITELTNKNVVLAPDVKDLTVSAFIINRPFDQVLEMMAKSNQLRMTKNENDFYYLEREVTQIDIESQNRVAGRSQRINAVQHNSGELTISLNENGLLNVKAYEADLTSIILQAAEMLNLSYFMYNKPKDEATTFYASEITFDNLLDHIFKGKKYTYKIDNGIYVIGEQSTEGLRITELVQLENRTIETVLMTLPKALTEGVEVKEIKELNGLIISGSKPKLDELKVFIREIDKIVPLIQIEVLIVQYQKSHDVQTGLRAILSEEGKDVKTGGVLFPSTDVTLNATSINNLIESFNGFGVINLGKVTENFYANLTALENNSIINLQSTPKIATLNGFQAIVSIGQTSYYFEQTNRLITSGVNENILQSGQWKPTEANLRVTITPFVSKDEQVTLTVNVEKSAFIGRSGENAPPDRATQQFQSLIRVKNNEMILLGGLDELDRQDTGSGTPLLARIPVIKWFFSSKRKSRSKSKLHVFIKPTIIY